MHTGYGLAGGVLVAVVIASASYFLGVHLFDLGSPGGRGLASGVLFLGIAMAGPASVWVSTRISPDEDRKTQGLVTLVGVALFLGVMGFVLMAESFFNRLLAGQYGVLIPFIALWVGLRAAYRGLYSADTFEFEEGEGDSAIADGLERLSDRTG